MTDSIGTALVTGASAGIGAVYADRLAKRGYDLVLVARDAGRLEELAGRLRAETGRTIEVLRADLTVRADVAAVEARLGAEPAVTMLVNNAGMALKGGLFDADVASVEAVVALNVTAATLLAVAAGRAFVARGSGAIINLASVMAFAAEMGDGAYCGSKAYILTFSQSLAATLEPQGIRVQAVLPGATRTEIWERSGMDVDAFPAEMIMGVEDLVDAALVGFDAGETVTIPPLAEEQPWLDLNAARQALMPIMSRSEPGARYRPNA
jgi:short-subunit dehydrogenase